MIRKEIERLQYLLTTIPHLLRDLDEERFSFKPDPDIWSSKEIIGHLIDEATNNYQTLARLQLEQDSQIFYDLHYWNRFGFYNKVSLLHIIFLWETYNRQLLDLIKAIPEEYLQRECYTGGAGMLSIEFLIRNYLENMELHLAVIVCYQTSGARINP
jgi:hypothetical protein